jgi:cell division septum initiation protein DivIVA
VSEKQQMPGTAQGIDLDAVQRLVDQLEEDLARVRSGTEDIERVREEVDSLKRLLNAPARPHLSVHDALHRTRSALDRQWADAARTEAFVASRYIAEIGRILGM